MLKSLSAVKNSFVFLTALLSKNKGGIKPPLFFTLLVIHFKFYWMWCHVQTFNFLAFYANEGVNEIFCENIALC